MQTVLEGTEGLVRGAELYCKVRVGEIERVVVGECQSSFSVFGLRVLKVTLVTVRTVKGWGQWLPFKQEIMGPSLAVSVYVFIFGS